MFDKSSTAKRHCTTWLGIQPTSSYFMRCCVSLSSSIASASHALSLSFQVRLSPNRFFVLCLAEYLEDDDCARVKVGVRSGLLGRHWYLNASSRLLPSDAI
jgi:hypothetical protein